MIDAREQSGWRFVAVAIVLATVSLAAQRGSGTAGEFDVVSIKPNPRPAAPVGDIERNFLRESAYSSRAGEFQIQGVTVRLLIELAYDLKEFQVAGGPGWIDAERFDIAAKGGGAPAFPQMRPLLRTLLADRFQLKTHREPRSLPVYEMRSVNAAKLPPMKDGGCITVVPGQPMPASLAPGGPVLQCGGVRRRLFSDGRVRIETAGVPMSKLVEVLSEDAGRVVVDRTGITYLFSFTLEFAPMRDLALAGQLPAGLTLQDAVKDQLGLELTSRRDDVDVLVIDRVERPTAN